MSNVQCHLHHPLYAGSCWRAAAIRRRCSPWPSWTHQWGRSCGMTASFTTGTRSTTRHTRSLWRYFCHDSQKSSSARSWRVLIFAVFSWGRYTCHWDPHPLTWLDSCVYIHLAGKWADHVKRLLPCLVKYDTGTGGGGGGQWSRQSFSEGWEDYWDSAFRMRAAEPEDCTWKMLLTSMTASCDVSAVGMLMQTE